MAAPNDSRDSPPDIRPHAAIVWTILILALTAVGAAQMQLIPLLATAAGLLGLVWVATIREADRLEVGIRAATDEICGHCQRSGLR